MAIQFLHHIDLNDNQLQEARLHNTSTAPSTNDGQIYFDTSTGVELAKYYTTKGSGSWVTIDPITAASFSGNTLTLTRLQDDLEVDLSSLTPTLRAAGTGLSLDGNTINANVDSTVQSVSGNNVSATASRTYKVQVDSSDNLVVNVPWSDTDTNTNQLTTWDLLDDDNDSFTIGHDKHVKFTASTGTAGTNITGAGTSSDPYVVAITLPDTNTVDMGDGFTVEANTNTATTTITESDTLKLLGAATNNFITTTSTPDGTIRFTLSASGTRNNTTYLRGDNTFAAIDTITGTTYDLAVAAGGSNSSAIELTGSNNTTDTVTIEGTSTTVKVTESGNTITLDLQDNVTIAQNLIVSGNLTVDGSTTTVESTVTTFTDPIIELNRVADGGTQADPTTSSGIQVNRAGANDGSSLDVQLVWMEDTDDWEFQAYNHESNPVIKKYKIPTSFKTTIGGSASINVDHYLGTRDVIVQLYDTSTYETVYADVTRTSEQRVNIEFGSAPDAGDVTVLILSAQGEQ